MIPDLKLSPARRGMPVVMMVAMMARDEHEIRV
jgi:hypothetical protein